MPGGKWTPDDKIRIVLESLTTNITVAELCRKYNVNPNQYYVWKQRFIDGGKAALSHKPGKNQVTKEAEIERLKKLIGEQTIVIDAFKKTLEAARRG
ncbi:transposase [Nitrososphaera sp.]|uniref:transposase n=1 Tax=Nitrososphaera sp. TaxID=1971748 RepID=UPI002EDB8B52